MKSILLLPHVLQLSSLLRLQHLNFALQMTETKEKNNFINPQLTVFVSELFPIKVNPRNCKNSLNSFEQSRSLCFDDTTSKANKCSAVSFLCYHARACCLVLTRLDGRGPKVQNKSNKKKNRRKSEEIKRDFTLEKSLFSLFLNE